MKRLVHGLLGCTLTLLVGCQTMPALTSLALAFGEDLLAATSVNYSPRYALQVEELLTVMARQATGLEFEQQLARSGYQPPRPDYARAGQQPRQPEGSQYPGHGQEAAVYTHGQDPYVIQQPGYDQGTYQDPYTAWQPDSDPGTYPDSYAAEETGYAQGHYQDFSSPSQLSGYGSGQDPYSAEQSGYDQGAYAYRPASAPGSAQSVAAPEQIPIALGVALLAQRQGSDTLEPIIDGDTLRDGRGDPNRSDRLKVHFQANCACHVYVIGIDATGFVAKIFPDLDGGLANPVRPGVNYLLPGGSQWWALDDFRGIEQIYFVAAEGPRPELEAAIAALASQPRQLAGSSYQPVQQPAVIPQTRGLVRVDAAGPVPMPAGGSASPGITPTIFSGTAESGDLVITRWFHHQ